MSLRVHPVQSLRQVVREITDAVNASAALSAEARRRQLRLERGEKSSLQSLDI